MPPLLTNTFAQCQVLSLEWHVYSLSTLLETSKSKKPSTLPFRVETTDLTVYLQRLEQRNVICTLVDAFSANDPAFVNLWVFIVNGVQSGVPVEPPTGVLETQTGSWTRLDGYLACTIQTHLFSTLSFILTCQLLSQDEFKRTKDEFFAIYAANFMARCASLTDLSHKHMYLDETVPTPALQLSFALIDPSHLLTVTVRSSRQRVEFHPSVQPVRSIVRPLKS
ncbi:hypothetical protein PsorP6_019008 [Peronosclerospora sorghi]|nr:hypothetical protein PsorP6_019089 [Peronosclerospora sorghi]KAI9895190.1 hypothetical protein PsorP6_019008 [Peronosclerospora sorghi]